MEFAQDGFEIPPFVAEFEVGFAAFDAPLQGAHGIARLACVISDAGVVQAGNVEGRRLRPDQGGSQQAHGKREFHVRPRRPACAATVPIDMEE